MLEPLSARLGVHCIDLEASDTGEGAATGTSFSTVLGTTYAIVKCRSVLSLNYSVEALFADLYWLSRLIARASVKELFHIYQHCVGELSVTWNVPANLW